jgi:hypothetical protein
VAAPHRGLIQYHAGAETPRRDAIEATGISIRRNQAMPKGLRKFIGLVLLFATVGVAAWQALWAV